MAAFGTTIDDLGAVAVAQRSWAADNDLARFREPITMEDHHASRLIADPLRLLDCCMVSNGAVAFVVTSAERAAHLRNAPVHVRGCAQSHPGYSMESGSDFGLRSGAATSGPVALERAQVSLADVDLCQLYDCYSFTVLLTLEDYGFCAKGEAGEFVAGGATSPGGRLPVNTGGGQLSSFYLWGSTPLHEAVHQVRGSAGRRQVAAHDVCLVSGNGGLLDHHGTLVLGREAV
jgi:acetyl-CoA acetyltransferase